MFEIAGVIDADYRGNVGIVLFNHNNSDFISKMSNYYYELVMILYNFSQTR